MTGKLEKQFWISTINIFCFFFFFFKILFERNQISKKKKKTQVKDLRIWHLFTLPVERLKGFSRRYCFINVQSVSHVRQRKKDRAKVERIG